MSDMLSDGTCVPSFLGVTDSSRYTPASQFTFNQISLKQGRVIKAYNVDDKQNISKKVLLYDVMVEQGVGSGGTTSIVYPRVQVASIFGGVADYCKWTPRIETFDLDKGSGLGSRVLLLCVNGDMQGAYIIAGLSHPDDTRKDADFKDNHRFQWEFNGAHLYINNDGEIYATHRGATNADGTIKDDKGSKTFIGFTKAGVVQIGVTKEDTELDKTPELDTDKPSFQLDKQKDTISLFAKSNISNETQDKFLIKTTTGVIVNEGGSDPQEWLRGTKFREQQKQLHESLKNGLQQLSTMLNTASTSLKGVVIAAPPTSNPLVQATSTALGSAASAASQMATAISQFEAQSHEYLSENHKFSDKP